MGIALSERIRIVQEDITSLRVTAIVNAANNSLSGGGGVDGAIHRAAGPELLKACQKLGGCDTGKAKITPGFSLPADYVIHTVGPVWQGGNNGEPELLASCYQTSLDLAGRHQLKSISFPAISTGVYGYPVNLAALIALQEINLYLSKNKYPELVYLVCFNDKAYNFYLQAIPSFS